MTRTPDLAGARLVSLPFVLTSEGDGPELVGLPARVAFGVEDTQVPALHPT